jgi:hypothetical protein
VYVLGALIFWFLSSGNLQSWAASDEPNENGISTEDAPTEPKKEITVL